MREFHYLKNAYVAVELRGKQLVAIGAALAAHLQNLGVVDTHALTELHLSLAYGEGRVPMSRLKSALRTWARTKFSVHVQSFAILQ